MWQPNGGYNYNPKAEKKDSFTKDFNPFTEDTIQLKKFNNISRFGVEKTEGVFKTIDVNRMTKSCNLGRPYDAVEVVLKMEGDVTLAEKNEKIMGL